MQPFDEQAAATLKVSASDNWLQCQQGLALPALPPTTPEAQQYFFVKICEYAASATANGKSRLDYTAFAQDWNQSADGKDHFYITTEVLASYAKTWEKIANICASQEMIQDKIDLVEQSHQIVAASGHQFPTFLTGNASAIQPLQGLIEMDSEQPIPASVLVDLPVSRAPMMQLPEPPWCPPSPPVGSGPPEVLQNDPMENIVQLSQQKLFVFMFQILLYYLTDLFEQK
jgi:hypothetical protein